MSSPSGEDEAKILYPFSKYLSHSSTKQLQLCILQQAMNCHGKFKQTQRLVVILTYLLDEDQQIAVQTFCFTKKYFLDKNLGCFVSAV